MNERAKTYEDGLVEGQLKAIEATLAKQDKQIYSHEKRLRMLERLAWIATGAVLIVQAMPVLKAALEVLQ